MWIVKRGIYKVIVLLALPGISVSTYGKEFSKAESPDLSFPFELSAKSGSFRRHGVRIPEGSRGAILRFKPVAINHSDKWLTAFDIIVGEDSYQGTKLLYRVRNGDVFSPTIQRWGAIEEITSSVRPLLVGDTREIDIRWEDGRTKIIVDGSNAVEDIAPTSVKMLFLKTVSAKVQIMKLEFY